MICQNCVRLPIGYLKLHNPLNKVEKRQIASWLEDSGIGVAKTSIEAKVSEAITLTDATTKQQIADALSKLYHAAKRFAEIEAQFEQNRKFILQRSASAADAEASAANYAASLGKPHAETAVDKSLEGLIRLYDALKVRRAKLESRHGKLRAWIDRYLDTTLG